MSSRIPYMKEPWELSRFIRAKVAEALGEYPEDLTLHPSPSNEVRLSVRMAWGAPIHVTLKIKTAI